jgi:macrodomain Ter protein organizer (MatP/YcbG family)
MKLNEVNEILDHKITSGSEHQWKCYPDGRYLDYESDFAHVSVIYNTTNQEIYQADISVKREAWDEDKKPYRWIDPDHKDAFYKEAKKRKVDPDQAWDDVKWIDLEMEEDFLEKAAALFNGEECDTRVKIEFDLDDRSILQLATEAHKRDITLNKMIEIILQEVIDRHRVNGTLA